ncbi:cystinosin [Penicillium cinerascens]|uniref:Cystinosin n=1 Tax=Penicillium cinerascens TaxID=70096 RepID=A0A9W9JFT8_9EURO|nr:cystinosin [Penicillium cinerascens]KAJ5195231.1 cystinosin [Penicillium cinerascens]
MTYTYVKISDISLLGASICGWLYFLAWSASFYAQPLLNWRHQSTKGLLIDYPLLNVWGFVCYTVSIFVLLLSPTVKAQYVTRHPSHPDPTVRWIDLAFAVHALLLSLLTLSQFKPRLWRWHDHQNATGLEFNNARPARTVCWLLAGAGLVVIISIAAATLGESSGEGHPRWLFLDVVPPWYRKVMKSEVDLFYSQITTLSLLKVLLTIVKYVPQALSHIRQRSTFGFSITQVLLDTTGGIFSPTQLLLDSIDSGDIWNGAARAITENPGKLGLACVSLAFDGLFVIQH